VRCKFRDRSKRRFSCYLSRQLGHRDDDPNNILTVVQNSTTDPIADAWTTYSSRRWKTNIKSIERASDKIKRLRGVYFDWKKLGSRYWDDLLRKWARSFLK